MHRILGILIALSFLPPASAQQVIFLTKDQARAYIQSAAKDPNLAVSSDQQGQVEIKPRTPETIDTKPDPVEVDKNSNWQMMFGLGFNIGANFVSNAVAKQGALNDTDFPQYGLKLGFEAVIHPPHVKFKRWSFGASHSFANGLIGDKPSYYIPRKEGWTGVENGLVPRDVGSTRITNYFVEYDALMFPGDDPRAAFSAGYYWGKARTDYNSDSSPYNDYTLYHDQGVQFRVRGFFGGGLTPYVLVKLSNQRQHSFVFGFSVERGPKMNVPPKKTK